MSMADRLLHALAHSASRQHGGEPVSELAHSLQCADLALDGGADEELVLACLLHDVGRYALDQTLVLDSQEPGGGARPGARGHPRLGAELIAPWVPARVAWLVAMHADAKRYLCATEPGYCEALTPASKHTLTLQGVIVSAAEVKRLEARPWLADALWLRRWDDQAKMPGKPTRPLGHWEPIIRKYFEREREEARR
jgi:predicted HD phosphohydrolase